MSSFSESRNIKSGIILSYMYMGISVVTSMVLTKVILRNIGDYNYGLFSFVNSITAWLTVISAALNASYVRFETLEAKSGAGTDGTVNTLYFKLLTILGLIVLVIGLAIVGGLYITGHEFLDYSLEDSLFMYKLFALAIINISLSMPAVVFTLYVTYKKQFIYAKVFAIINIFVNFSGQFLIAICTHNIVLISCFSILMTLETWAVNFLYCKRKLNIRFARTALCDNKALIKSISAFSGIILFNTIVDQVNTNVDKTLLGIYASPTEVTVYQIGQQLNTIVVSMSVAISAVFVPTINELSISGRKIEINRLYLKISKLQSIVLCCVTFGFISCGREFMMWWLGDSMKDAYYVSAGLMLIALCPLTINSSIEIQRARNRHLFRAITYFALAIANVGLSILLLHIFDSTHAIFACLIGTMVTTFLSHWISMNIYNYSKMELPVGKYLITLSLYFCIGLLGFGATHILNTTIMQLESHLLRFLVQGTIFTVCYLTICGIANRKLIINYLKRHNVRSSNE